MTTSHATGKKPLWFLIEENFLELSSQDLSEENRERTIHRIAGELDNTGYNVSRNGDHMLQLRWAMDEMCKVGRPFMKDFNEAIAALTLEDLADPISANAKLVRDLGEAWPKIQGSERKADVLRIVEKTKLDLLISKAKGLPGDEGIRLLIEEEVASEVITKGLGITGEKLGQVKTAVEKERAERARVEKLLKAVEGKSNEEKVRHLFANNVSDKLIIEMAEVDQGAVDGVKQAIEAELKEKQRLEEEATARKKEETAGPPLEEIPPDQMLEHIEAIREILEFSDKEKEIRVMCEQSAIPTRLVDIAVSEPEKLDERGRRRMEMIKRYFPKSYAFEKGKVPLPFPILIDSDAAVSKGLGVFTTEWGGSKIEQNIPTTYIIDSKGMLQFKYISQNTFDRPGPDYLQKILTCIND